MLNTRNEAKNTVFYSCLTCFVDTVTLNMYIFMSNTGFTTRNALFVFVWLRPRNTLISIQHVVLVLVGGNICGGNTGGGNNTSGGAKSVQHAREGEERVLVLVGGNTGGGNTGGG